MKKALALLATLSLATATASPVLSKTVNVNDGYGWKITGNTRFEFVPSTDRETRVIHGEIETGLNFVWTRDDGKKFYYPIAIEHKGNTCGRPPTPPGSSHLTVCVDQSYYVVRPKWKMRGLYSNVKLVCDRPIYVDGKRLNLKAACNHFLRSAK